VCEQTSQCGEHCQQANPMWTLYVPSYFCSLYASLKLFSDKNVYICSNKWFLEIQEDPDRKHNDTKKLQLTLLFHNKLKMQDIKKGYKG
jgi:hypothetical protein